MNIILFSLNIFIVNDIRILPSVTQISTLNFVQCEKKKKIPLKPIVNTFITAIILTFRTNFIQVLIRIPTMDNKDMGNIGSEFPRIGSSTFKLRSIPGRL